MSTENNAHEFTNGGWYDAKAKNWRWAQAKSTGNWMLEVWFELSENGHALGDLPGWLVVTDNTIEKKVEQLMAMGYAPVSGDIGQEIGCDDAGVCFGGLDANSVRVVVKYGDDGRAKVDNVVAQKARGAAQAVDQGALRGFGAQMRGAVLAAMQKAKGATAGAAPAQQRAQAPQPRPAAPPQRPAPQPTRGPGSPSRASTPAGFGGTEDVPDFSVGADDCPF